MDQALWEKCVAFHGHQCPGLAIGYRAATLALEHLGLDGPSADMSSRLQTSSVISPLEAASATPQKARTQLARSNSFLPTP